MLAAEAAEGLGRLMTGAGVDVDMTPFVISRLQAWYVHGRITLDELEEAIDDALHGRTDE
jgi:hypothetical protein